MDLTLVELLVALIKSKTAVDQALSTYREGETEQSHRNYLRKKMLYECCSAEYQETFDEWSSGCHSD